MHVLRCMAISILVMAGVQGCAFFESTTTWFNPRSDESSGMVQRAPYELGKAHLAAGQYGLAVRAFRSAFARGDDTVETLNGLAAAYDLLGRRELADQYYQMALNQDPNSLQTLNNLGYSFYIRGQLDRALEFLVRAEKAAKGHPMVAANLELVRGARLVPEQPDAMHAVLQSENAKRLKVLPAAWVMRSSPSVQELVTNADLNLRKKLVIGQLEPRLSAPVVDGGPALNTDSRPRIQMVRGVATLLTTSQTGSSELTHRPPEPVALSGVAREQSPSVGSQLGLDSRTDPANRPRQSPVTLPKDVVVEVSNGAGRPQMAARMGEYLHGVGIAVARFTNAHTFGYQRSSILYKPGGRTAAEALAAALPNDVALSVDATQQSDLRLRLGADLLGFDQKLFARAVRRI